MNRKQPTGLRKEGGSKNEAGKSREEQMQLAAGAKGLLSRFVIARHM